MAYVQVRTDQTKYSAVDGVVGDSDTGAYNLANTGSFDTSVQATTGGFGVLDPYTGTIEILDAMPLGRAAVQLAVEAGSAALIADSDSPLIAGFTAIDFATQDLLTETEVDAGLASGLDSDMITSDLT